MVRSVTYSYPPLNLLFSVAEMRRRRAAFARELERGGVSCAPSATASIATWHYSTSKRLAGISTAREGSSSL